MAIKHADTKTPGAKGLSSEWNKDHVIDGNVDFDQNQPLSMAIENRTDFPAGPVEGQIIHRTDLHNLYVWDGTNWDLCNLKTKTSYWSCSEVNFINVAGINYANISGIPNGAVMTGATVYGNNAGESWFLMRITLSTGWYDILAGENFNAESITISDPIINNSLYAYFFYTSALGAGDLIYGARIKYTTYYT